MRLDNKRVHPELRDDLNALEDNIIDIDNIEEARRESDAFMVFVPSDAVEVEDLIVPGVDGEPDVPVTVITPRGRNKEQLLPGMLYMHGGGYTNGLAKEPSINRYAEQINCVLVSVGYRRAPENPYPAALNDCYSALVWLYENAGQLGVDSSRIAVVGVSAGGGLAAALALYARDKKGPPICFHAPLAPMLDDRNITESSKDITDGRVWDRTKNVNGWRAYLGKMEGEPPPYAAPARAADLSGLPPMFCYVGELDMFRDETIEYVARAAKAGVPVELLVYRGCYHGCELHSPNSDIVQRIRQNNMAALKAALWEM
ncbi:MAG: alpha/beta hydrolase [Rikenellaceae bacterium]|nr:alpha/beta hydrolase [Rikenellaceae bacterium]